MNDFQIYELLCEMSKLAEQYTDGKEFSEKIRNCADRVSSQLYRAAVIGEFKRGKSSMINALLGTEVLPTSVLPMTAVNTRVTYGEEKRIIIRYKNGVEEEATIEQLIDFATKYDEEKAHKASLISEILVYYPSVFCKNHIEIIDTPGMNDNDEMTAVTMGVLGSIDAAIMVISAQEPLSMTEQELILAMIAEQGIHHIVFVVTHIDAVSDDPEDQDRMIEFIRGRIKNDLLKRADEKFKDNANLVEKTHRILEQPDVFGVSSVLAIKGFIQDSERMLKESRFPKFKKELLTLLTAAQSTDIRLNAKDYADEIKTNVEAWGENDKNNFNSEHGSIVELIEKYNVYFQSGERSLNNVLWKMDYEISHIGLNFFANQSIITEFIQSPHAKKLKKFGGAYHNFFCEAADRLKCVFINQLYSIKLSCNDDSSIRAALQTAVTEAYKIFKEVSDLVKSTVGNEIQKANDLFLNLRPKYDNFEREKELLAGVQSFVDAWSDNNKIPELQWTINPIPEVENLVGADIMPYIKDAIIRSLEKYANDVSGCIALWKNELLSYNISLLADKAILDRLQNDLNQNSARMTMLELNHSKHIELISEIQEKLSLPQNMEV